MIQRSAWVTGRGNQIPGPVQRVGKVTYHATESGGDADNLALGFGKLWLGLRGQWLEGFEMTE